MQILDKGIQLGLSFVDGVLICFALSGMLTLCGLDVRTPLWGTIVVIVSLIVIHLLPDGLLGMGYQQGKQRRRLYNCEKPPTPKPQLMTAEGKRLWLPIYIDIAAARGDWKMVEVYRGWLAEGQRPAPCKGEPA